METVDLEYLNALDVIRSSGIEMNIPLEDACSEALDVTMDNKIDLLLEKVDQLLAQQNVEVYEDEYAAG